MTQNRENAAVSISGVSISDMARAVNLSRQRFHQLMKSGVFPEPKRDEVTGRPYYDEAGQAQCLEVRKKNFGVNGKVVLFYARRLQAPVTTKQRPVTSRSVPTEQTLDVLEGIRALGITQATPGQVKIAVEELIPKGTAGVDMGEIIRAVFLKFRKNSADKQER